MFVYLLKEYSDDLHTTLGVFASQDKACAVAKDVAYMADLQPEDSNGLNIVEYCNNHYDHVVWVEEAQLIV